MCICTCTVYYSYIFYMFHVIFLLLYKRTTSLLFSSYWGIFILSPTLYHFNFGSTQAYHLNLPINLSCCFKNNSVVIRCFPTHSTRGITTRTHTHAHTRTHTHARTHARRTMVNTSFVFLASSASIVVCSEHPLTTGT